MDPLTHTLLGGVLAETRLGRTTALAAPALLVGANLPDLDALTYLSSDPDLALGFRRGWTHGILAMAVLPLILWLALLGGARLRRNRAASGPPLRRGPLLGLAFLAVATHPLLDWLNTYGMRWLMPFDGRWFYGDTLFVIDPWLWMILGGTIVVARRGGRRDLVLWVLLGAAAAVVLLLPRGVVPAAAKVGWLLAVAGTALLRATVAGRADPRRVALVGVAGAILYVGAMMAVSSLGRALAAEDLAGRGVDVVRLMVGPMPANPFTWDVVAETPQGYRHGRLHWAGGPALRMRGTLPRPSPSPAVAAARSAPFVRGALAWMRFPYTEIEHLPDGYLVYFLDARYLRSRGTGFGAAVVRLDADLRVVPP